MYNNSITVVGNLTKDPEEVVTRSGKVLARFTVAFNPPPRRGEQRSSPDDASFFDVVAFEPLAVNILNSLHRGNQVVVVGSLRQQRWKTPEGDNRSRIEIRAEQVGPSLSFATAEPVRNDRPVSDGGPF